VKTEYSENWRVLALNKPRRCRVCEGLYDTITVEQVTNDTYVGILDLRRYKHNPKCECMLTQDAVTKLVEAV